MSFHFFSYCSTCKNKKVFIAHRSYKMLKVSPVPITSKDEICGDCFNKIKELTKN